jgi:hypothetical protein
MPAVILGTQMERGSIKWRAITSGLEGSGPADKTLVIKFDGDPSALPGFDGSSLDIAMLRQTCSLVEQEWIPAEGVFQCSIILGAPPSIAVSFV